MDFFKFCQRCEDSTCCTKPFYAFVTQTERDKIIEYIKLKNINLDEKDVFQIYTFDKLTKIATYLISKKSNGKCLFLKEDLTCQIQDVKPQDCLNWPLTFDYKSKSNKIIIYLGQCLFVKELEKLKQLKTWLDDSLKIMIQNLSKYNKIELMAYTTLPSVSKFKVLAKITYKER